MFKGNAWAIYASMQSYLQPHSTIDIKKPLLFFLESRYSLAALSFIYGYELSPFFPPHTLTIVFYGRNTLGMMMMNIDNLNNLKNMKYIYLGYRCLV